MKKYKLINKTTNESHLCIKHTVGDFDYYLDSENLNMKEIATNNPTSDLPKIINEVEELSNEYFNINRGAYTMGIDSAFESGYYAAEEKKPFSKEDMINFGQYCIRSFALYRNHDSNYTSRIITEWEENHKVETLYFI